MNKYDQHILDMQEFPGFYKQWVSRLGFYKTHEDAYEATEEFYQQYFGKRRYKSFESFKSLMTKNK